MFLSDVRIKGFRCFLDTLVSLSEITYLLGANNSGKTAFIDAVRIALSSGYNRSLFCEYDFRQTENRELSELDPIEIVLTFKERESGEWDDYVMPTFFDVLQTAPGDSCYRIILKTKCEYNSAVSDFETTRCFLNIMGDVIVEKQYLVNSLLKIAPVLYVSPLRDAKTTFGGRSQVWGGFMKNLNIAEEELQGIQTQIKDVNANIIDADPDLKQLTSSLRQLSKVLDFDEEEFVAVDALPLKPWDLLSKAQLVLKSPGNSTPMLPIYNYGHGTQSTSSILLHQAYISVLLKKKEHPSAEALLALEEPEAHLHPQAIRSIGLQIKRIDSQQIISTHSPYLVQSVNLEDVRFFASAENGTKVLKIEGPQAFPYESIPESLEKFAEHSPFLRVNDIAKTLLLDGKIPENRIEGFKNACKQCPELLSAVLSKGDFFSLDEIHKLNTYIQRSRGDILFAKQWLLYEGQSEDVVIPYLAAKLDCDLDEHGISSIVYRDNGSAGAFVKLAQMIEMPWVIFSDNDEQGNNTKKEIENAGISSAIISDRLFYTKQLDFEHELVDQGCLEAYVDIYEKEIQSKGLSDLNDPEEKAKLIEIIKDDKVDSAYKLVEYWDEKGLSPEDVPFFVQELIAKVKGAL